MKTEANIREELYQYISQSLLTSSLNGRLYKYEEERAEKGSEDIVIVPLTETPISQLQEMIVLVRIYVSDLYDDSSLLYRADGIRLKEIEEISKKVFAVFRTKNARCSLESIKTFRVDSKKEHCIVNRINYKYCNY